MNSLRSLFSGLSISAGGGGGSLLNSLQTPQLVQQRFRRVYPIIRGYPRPLPAHMVRPEPSKYNWIPILPPDGRYTITPLKIRKLAGRHPETGRVVVKTLGGGNKKYFRWIDYSRRAYPDGTPKVEKVYNIRYDPLRTTKLALVGGGKSFGSQNAFSTNFSVRSLIGNTVKWIMATEKMQVGDIISTYSDIPRNPVRPKEGDSHPIGALPLGTKVHNVQILPQSDKTTICYAGQYAELIRRVGKRNYLVESRGNREFCIEQSCMVTVGRLSNPYHDEINLMCPQRSRWLGKRPKSGAWHKKDGYAGRKINPPKAVKDHFQTAMRLQKSGQTLFGSEYEKPPTVYTHLSARALKKYRAEGKPVHKEIYTLEAF